MSSSATASLEDARRPRPSTICIPVGSMHVLFVCFDGCGRHKLLPHPVTLRARTQRTNGEISSRNDRGRAIPPSCWWGGGWREVGLAHWGEGFDDESSPGRLRKMDGEKVNCCLERVWSAASGDRKPVLRWVWSSAALPLDPLVLEKSVPDCKTNKPINNCYSLASLRNLKNLALASYIHVLADLLFSFVSFDPSWGCGGVALPGGGGAYHGWLLIYGSGYIFIMTRHGCIWREKRRIKQYREWFCGVHKYYNRLQKTIISGYTVKRQIYAWDLFMWVKCQSYKFVPYKFYFAISCIMHKRRINKNCTYLSRVYPISTPQ